jgi:lipopolysaccharide transport system ATP-binding protein
MTLGLGLREDLSGRENIYLDGEVQGKTREEVDKVINEIIDFADLGEFIDYPIKTYSTGMKARLAFSMIVTIEPEILIIDEALSVGDANFATKASKKIAEICDRGKIVIIVSHGMGSVIDMCNRCFWMDQGKIIMDGDPKAVTQAYIAAVRQENDLLLLKKFYGDTLATYNTTECQITELNTHRVNSNEMQALYHTGEDLCVTIMLNFSHITDAILRLQVIRLDGLLVTDSKIEITDLNHNNQQKSYNVNLNPLILAWGTYKIRLQVFTEQKLIAERAAIVEIEMLNRPTGGRPVLVYPAKITVEKEQTTSLEKSCLDLIETM